MDVPITAKIPEEMKEKIAQMAKEEDRSLYSMIRILLREAFKWREIYAKKGVPDETAGNQP